MKKNFLKMAALSFLVLACSEDDTIPEVPPVDPPVATEASVVLNEVEYLGNRVEIFNNGDVVVDLENYFLCLAPGTYRQIGALETEGNLQLGVGEYLSVSYDMPNENGGLGLYINNSGFGDAANIADFVQWGAAGAVRESVAVTAGLWTAGEFVPVMGNENYSIVYDGEGNGAANWAETTTVTIGAENVLTVPEEMRRSIVFNEVQFGNLNQVEIYNNGDVTVDLSSYWLCLGPGRYAQIGGLTPVSGTAELPAGEFLVLPFNMDDADGLGLYSTNSFTSSDAIVDFVQWGAAGSPRENVAVEAGIWTAGDFVPAVGQSASIEYDGEGDASTDWAEEAIPSLGEPNDATARTTTFRVTLTNAAEIFNVHTFSERIRNSVNEGPGTLNQNGDQYQIQFQAVPGTKITPITMMGNSNDWFLAPEDLAGIPLWNDNGQPLNGVDIASELVLYDLGTEADNIPSAFPPAGANVGDADSNSTIRLVDRGGRRGDTYMTAVLDYAEGTNEGGTFTLTIEAVMTPQAAPDRGAILSEVQYQGTDYVEILNTSSSTIDLNNYWLCLGPGRYARIGTLTPVNGTIDLPAGEAVTLPFTMGDAEGLGLYNTNSFTDANAMADFVQWGEAGSARENVAVSAGLWTAGDFLPTVAASTNSIISNGIASGRDNWTETARPSFGSPNGIGAFNNGFVVTPGIVALHANNAPLFDLDETDRGEGLEAIAEDGMPGELFDFYREQGGSGFLRLTSTRTVFSPGVAYAFNGERDPFVLQGEVNNPTNGLEEIAEDGNNAVALDYLTNLGIPVAASDQTSNVGPGESLTFTLTVPEGQDFKLGFATMFVDTNDWFIAYNNAGFPLWDENGTPASGFGASEKSYLFDSGTEIDQITGFGADQAPRQGAQGTGAADPNNLVRRVGPSSGTFLTDVQFGKGAYDNSAGVVYVGDPRGGYNVIRVEIQPQ
ncbi:spondin domain-containing protein [uncultured Croceitalea sp.]|uniref:spondin domain-containing protein n=1 Tax=uncultured Croceitalea sp. TaxID=1798908 RepID=UPI003306083F